MYLHYREGRMDNYEFKIALTQNIILSFSNKIKPELKQLR